MMHMENPATLIDCLASTKASVVREACQELLERRDAPALIGGLKHAEPSVRKWCANLLGEMKERSAVPLLEEAVTDEFFSVKEEAVSALAKIGAIEAVPSIVDSLQIIPRVACAALCQLGAGEQLLNALKNPDARVRRAVLQCGNDLLKPLSSNVAQNVVTEMIDNDQDPEVVSEAVISLGCVGGVESFEHLLALLMSEKSYIVAAAGKALGFLAKRQDVLADRERRLSSAISCLVEESAATMCDRDKRDKDASEIEELADDRIIPVLGLFWQKYERLPRIRRRMASAARKVGALELLIKWAPELDEAAIELGKTGDKRALAPLLRLANARQLGAIAGLGWLGGSEAVDALIQLPCWSTETTNARAEALARTGDRRALPNLTASLQYQIDQRNITTMALLPAIGRLGDSSSVEVLLRAFRAFTRGVMCCKEHPIVASLRLLRERDEIKVEDIKIVDIVLGLWSDERTRAESLKQIVSSPDKRFTAVILNRLFCEVSRVVSEHSPCPGYYDPLSFIPLALKYREALETLADEQEIQSWVFNPDFDIFFYPEILITVLGRIGTVSSIDPLISIIKDERTSKYYDYAYAGYLIDVVRVIGAICQRVGTDLGRARMASVKRVLKIAAKDDSDLAEEVSTILENKPFAKFGILNKIRSLWIKRQK